MPDHEPIFIMGAPRSGTTLLFQMLDSHPDLHLVNEFWKLYPHVDGEIVDSAALDRLLRSHLRLPAADSVGGAMVASDPFAQLEAAFAAKLASVGKKRWGIKDPRLTTSAAAFLERYPSSRWLVIVRDPRAVIRSQIESRTTIANVYYGATAWQREVRRQRRFCSEHPDHCQEVRYERLLREPEAVLRRVCAFVGVEYMPRLLRYYEHTSETTLHRGNVNITQPLETHRADAWRSELSARQVGVIEAVAGPAMEELGYERAGSPTRVGASRRLAYGIHQWVLTNYWWQRRKRVGRR